MPNGQWPTKRSNSDFEFRIAIWRRPSAPSRLEPCHRINTSNMFSKTSGLRFQTSRRTCALKSYEDSIENIVVEGIIVTPAEAEAEYRKANEKIKIDYIGFSPTKFIADIKPTPEEISAYFDKNKGFYTVPETRHLAAHSCRSS